MKITPKVFEGLIQDGAKDYNRRVGMAHPHVSIHHGDVVETPRHRQLAHWNSTRGAQYVDHNRAMESMQNRGNVLGSFR